MGGRVYVCACLRVRGCRMHVCVEAGAAEVEARDAELEARDAEAGVRG